MKLQITTLLCGLMLLVGCQNDPSDTDALTLSESEITVAGGASVAQVKITYPSTWTASSNSAWCVVDRPNGSGDYTLTINVSDNPTMQTRTATVTIQTQKAQKTITLTQAPAQISEVYTYQMPVIFHVLYKDKNSHTQYVDARRIAEVLAQVNKLYRASSTSIDMQVQFILATSDPTGKRLEEPGVNRRQINNTQIDAMAFMTENNTQYTQWIWDPNQYINIMLYEFKPMDGNRTLLGVSHLPYASKSHPLAGLTSAPSDQLLISNLTYPHCVSINNQFIYSQSTDEQYQTTDVTVTLAHELGHYLGLFHTFSENKNGEMTGCMDTDYCLDTPTYDREAYQAWEAVAMVHEPFHVLVKRTSCDGSSFISRNILDYEFGWSDQFTNDQRTRVRHMLTTGVLIPGPKVGLKLRSRAESGPISLPMRAIP